MQVRSQLKILSAKALALTLLLTAAPLCCPADDAASAAPPPAALTAAFSAFLSDVLSGRLPAENLTPQMKAALTPAGLSEIDAQFTPLGAFARLQFLRQDSLQGYRRYHYTAIFKKGQMGMMFVTDSSGAIAGFFKDPDA